MAFRSKFIIFLVVFFTLNITELESRKNTTKSFRKRNKYPVTPGPIFPTMDYGVSAVVDNASDVFRKLIGKLVAKKKLVGFDSGWYW